MRLKARINFAEPWSSLIPEVAKQCGMTVDDYCRRAVQLITKQGLEEGQRQQEEGDSKHENSSPGDNPVSPEPK